MAQVRITHLDGTVDDITTSGNQQINVQQGDKIEVLNATLTSATVDGNNYVITLADPVSGTVEITFVDLFLLLAVGDPTQTAADGTTLTIGDEEIASIGDALGQIATAAGTAAGGDLAGPRSDAPGEAPTQPDFDPIGAADPDLGEFTTDLPDLPPPPDPEVTPDAETPPPPEVQTAPTATDDFNRVTEDGEGFYDAEGGFGGSPDSFVFGDVIDSDPTGNPQSAPDSDPEGDTLFVVEVSNGTTFGDDTGDDSTKGNGVDPIGFENIIGEYGLLQMIPNDDSDGFGRQYLYQLDNSDPAVQALGAGETTTDVFVYRISDGNGGTDTATLTITIEGTNDQPIAYSDTNYGQAGMVAYGEHEAMNTDAKVAEGNVLQDIDHGTIEHYNPQNEGFDTINLADVEDTDVDTNDVLTVTDIQSETVGSTAVDANNSDTVIDGQYGTLTIHADGSYSYDVDEENGTVTALADGQVLSDTDDFTYSVSDGNGGTTGAVLSIYIMGNNDGPTASDDSNFAVAGGSPEAGADGVDDNVLLDISHPGIDKNNDSIDDGLADAADIDPDGDTLTVTSIESETVAVTGVAVNNDDTTIDGEYGTLTIHADGSYSYDVNEDVQVVKDLADGEVLSDTDDFIYTVSDGSKTDTATLSISIVGTNSGPTADADTNWGQAGMVAYGDGGNAALGDARVASGNVLTPDADHTDDYLAVTGSGDTFGDDADSDPDGDTLLVTTINSTTDGDVDVDEGNPTNDVTIDGLYGTLTIDGNGDYSYEINEGASYDGGTIANLADGEIGPDDVFTYTVTDGVLTDTQTLTITLVGANDGPTADADTNWAQAGMVAYGDGGNAALGDARVASGNVLTPDADHTDDYLAVTGSGDTFGDDADSDPDGDALLVTTINSSTDGDVDVDEGNPTNDVTIDGLYGTLTIDGNGDYSYEINEGASYDGGTIANLADGEIGPDDVFNYTVTDGSKTHTQTLTITLVGANDGPTAAPDQHLWVPSAFDDQAPEYSSPGGYPILIPMATDPDGDALTVTFLGVSDGSLDGQVGYYDGGFVAIVDGVVYDAAVLANLVYIPTATGDPLDDFDDQSFTYTVTDGSKSDSSTVTLHEVQHNDEPGLQALIGNGSSPLTSGNDQEGDVFLSQAFIDTLNGNGGTATFTLLTDFQKAPFPNSNPVDATKLGYVPEDEGGLFDDTHASVPAGQFGYDSDGDGVPDVFFAAAAAPNNTHPAVDRETEVSVTMTIVGATATLLGTTSDDGTYDAIFSLIEEDDTNADGVPDNLDVTWVYDDTTGLMKAVVDFGDAVLVDGSGNVLLGIDGTPISLTEYLNASTPTNGVDNDGYVATDGDQWQFIYFDNDGGSYQARFVSIDMTFDNPGDLGITVEGTEFVDVIYGTPDAGDSLNGLGGNDIIFGRGGDDTIDGGAGDDIINGGDGDDQLTGGTGADSFVYSADADIAGATIDTILDFGAADDSFDFSGLTGDLGDVSFDNSGSGGDIVIHFNGNSVAELDGTSGFTGSVAGGSTVDEVEVVLTVI